MKSKISIQSIFLLLLTVITISCSKSNGWVRNGLHGKVKSTNDKYYVTEYIFGEWTCVELCGLIHNSFTDKGVYSGTEFYNNVGMLNLKLKPKYEEGKLIDECQYNQEGKLICKIKYNQISEDVFESITFDENGRKTSKNKTYFKNNVFIGNESYSFEKGKIIGKSINDSNGNTLSYEVVDEKGKVETYERYEYLKFDKMNNWIKRLKFKSKDSKKPENLIIREIEYY